MVGLVLALQSGTHPYPALPPPCVQMRNSMVVGIDSYHDSSQKGRSVLGFIASTNATFTRWACVLALLSVVFCLYLSVCVHAML